MRPIVKWEVGHAYNDNEVVKASYRPYRSAKSVLIENLGHYCSYCEKAFPNDPADLDVEHVMPKSLHADKEYDWNNFLLSCTTCNGAGNKRAKDVNPEEIHLPYKNNTFLSFIYKAGGVVIVNPALNPLSKEYANSLLKLVGLDKSPSQSTPADKRCQERKDIWDIATRYVKKYESGDITIDIIMDLVTSRGGWSIWFTVFKGHDEVRKALIDDIPGTCKSCFDAKNHYVPIERNPGAEDPV